MGELIDYAAEEQDAGVLPELTTHIEDLDAYDTVVVGFPIWWYDMPQVMYSFFEEYDFAGKTIIPFTVHNGSRLSGTPTTIRLWRCQYHVVFAPKHRRMVIYGEIKQDIGRILRQLCQQKGVEIIEAELCKDHVHMLISIPLKYSVSQIMGYLERKSSPNTLSF